METVKLRAAVLKDKPVLLKFEQGVLEAERPYNSAIKSTDAFYYDLDDLIQSDKSHLIVAEVDEAVVGCGYSQIRESKQALVHQAHAYLGFMYVEPEYRGKAINKKIIDELFRWSKSQGVTDCYLDVYGGNQGAIRAYEKAGFVTSMIEMNLSLK